MLTNLKWGLAWVSSQFSEEEPAIAPAETTADTANADESHVAGDL